MEVLMLNLSIVFLAIDVLLVITLVFANSFEARKKTTALLPIIFLFYLVYLFDSYINKARMQKWCVDLFIKYNIIVIPGIPQLNSIHFSIGVVIIIEILVLYLMLYSLYANLFTYTPPMLLSNYEKKSRIWISIFWKILWFISINLFLIYILKTLNEIMQLPLGFLGPIFRIGVRL